MVSPEVATPATGDTVMVQWGFDSLAARVITVYRTPRGPRVTLAVPVLGPEGETLDEAVITLPLEAVEAPASR